MGRDLRGGLVNEPWVGLHLPLHLVVYDPSKLDRILRLIEEEVVSDVLAAGNHLWRLSFLLLIVGRIRIAFLLSCII